MTTEEFIKKRVKEVHGDKYIYSKAEYINMYTKVCIICPEHGEFWQLPCNHLKGSRCPKCTQSKLELEVMEMLNRNKINYIYQYPIKELKRYTFDFYLPDCNIAIECQGGQHFYPIEYFGGEDSFKKQIIRDKQKQNYCQEHNILLLYYSNLNYENVINSIDILLTKINA